MPRWLMHTLAVVSVLALVPFACVVRSRAVRSAEPRVHVIQDMDNQGRYKAQQANPIFADGRAMRLPIPGTVARGQWHDDDHLQSGLVGGEYAATFPMPLDAALLQRGRERYDIFCTPCHGLSGYGDGIVSRRAEALQQGTWVPPTSLHDDLTRSRPAGHLFNSITNGIRTMPAYGAAIPVEDRWAIVAYVRALQRSQRATIDDVPAQQRHELGPR